MVGWIGDIFVIPSMVREANENPVFIEKFKEQVRLNRKPPFSVSKFCSSLMVGYLWAQVFMIAIPDFEFMDINWKFLHWVVPFVVALGMFSLFLSDSRTWLMLVEILQVFGTSETVAARKEICGLA